MSRYCVGVCRFCGQTITIDRDKYSQEEADAAAAEICDCPGAKTERSIQKKIEDARHRIRQVFGEESSRLGFKPVETPELFDLMDNAAELVAREYISTAIFGIRGHGRAKIAITAKEKIKVERHETRSYQLEE